MESGSPRLLDPNLYRRGQLISSLARWISVGLGLTALLFLWQTPQARPRAALSIGLAYLVVFAACGLWRRRHPRSRTVKVVHDVADALAVGLGAATSGGLESPIWLLLYPHVVAVSVRGGLAYALAFGSLDAAIVLGLAALTPAQPLGALHAVAVLFCAFMGGTTSSYLHEVQRRLRAANLAQAGANQQLQGTLQAQTAAQQQQEATLVRLSESEERYRRLLERIQDGVVIVQDARVSYANRHFADLLGDTPEGLVGSELDELADPAERAALAERYRRWQQGLPGEAHFEARLRTRSGALRRVSLRVGTAEFEGRRAVVATVRDVTRQREMEQDLKAHAERLAAINEIAHAVNLSLTIDDILSVAAQEARRLVPFDRLTVALLDDEDAPTGQVVAAGVAGRASFERADAAWAFERPFAACEGSANPLPPGSPALLAQPAIRSLATVPLFTKERVIGSLNFGRLAAAPFGAHDLGVLEPVAHHIAIALDNARLLEAVRRRGHEFQSLLEIGRGILERLELDELLPLVARSVTRVMGTRNCMLMLRHGDRLELAAQEGFEPEAVTSLGRLQVGTGLTGWVAQEGRPLAIAEIREDPRVLFKHLAERYGYRSFLCVPLKRGREVLGTLSVVSRTPRRFGAAQQELMEAFADQAALAIENARLFEDARAGLARVSEANRRLEELDRLRQQYLRNVSHEFRTPLTVIKGYAEYLSDDGPEPGALRDISRVISDSCDRVIDLVDTLLEVSRLEQGGEPALALTSVDLGEVARVAAEALGRTAERKGVRLVLELCEPLRLEADTGLLQHLARKLVDNAVKYSPSGAAVVVRARPAGESLELQVEDAGIGIAAEHLPHIFEKFYMVDGGIARRVGGAGVGLYLVREIVRLHHGTVQVRSRPGEGTLFSVTLPIAPQGLAAPPPA
jgi:PAS domain S-box-containing protein